MNYLPNCDEWPGGEFNLQQQHLTDEERATIDGLLHQLRAVYLKLSGSA